MGDDIQLVSDGDGLAVFGNPAEVDQFLIGEGLASKGRLGSAISLGSVAATAGTAASANSGRWVKLSAESSSLLEKYGLVTNPITGLSMKTLRSEKGNFVELFEYADDAKSLFLDSAAAAAAGGLLSQLAMRQAMDEITDYLETINEKVDDVLRAQKDAVLADMIGVGFVLDDAMVLRDQVGRVSEVTWSKVQAAPTTIGRTEAYALRQLDAIAEKLEHKTSVADLAETSKDAESKVREWLAVLARCFQLQDEFTVLELDRVSDASPNELDHHRLALKAARTQRLEQIARSTNRLMARIDAAATTANKKVILHPIASREIVESSNQVAAGVVEFRGRLGIEGDRESLQAKKWSTAVVEMKDQALKVGAEGVVVAKGLGDDALDRTRDVRSRVGTNLSGLADRALRRRRDDDEEQD
jgi:hypothetical protein